MTYAETAALRKAYRTVVLESSGKVDLYRIDSDDKVKKLLAAAEKYNENPHYVRKQFTKYFKDDKKEWYGLFEDGRCMALCVLKHTPHDAKVDDIVLLAEIQSFAKGYGKLLMERLLSGYRNIWWVVDPNGGDKLLSFYEQFGLKRKTLERSMWARGKQQHFFYRASDKRREKMILELLDSLDASGNVNESCSGVELRPLFADMADYFDSHGCCCTPRPSVVLLDEPQDVFGKTGNYDCDGCVIRVYVNGRHPKDILRTFAHELFHHHQHLRDRRGFEELDKSGTIGSNRGLEAVEGDAYQNGNVLFRRWCDDRKDVLGARDAVAEAVSPVDGDDGLKFDSDGNGYSVMTKQGTYVAYMDVNVGYVDEMASEYSETIDDFDPQCLSFFDPFALICNVEYIHVEKPFRGLGYAKAIQRKAFADMVERRGIRQFLLRVCPDAGTSKESVVGLARKLGFTELQDTAHDGVIMGMRV